MALLGEVEQPARGADHDVDALAQRLDLRLVGASAVDRDDAQRRDRRPASREVAGDLHAQLAGRHDDEGLGTSRARGSPSAAPGARRGRCRCSSGTPNPSVLPMPVRAWPMRSSPASASGRVSSWMAKVRTMPASASARTISGRTPSSAKVGESSRTGAPACRGCAWRSSGESSGEFSGESMEFSLRTDRVIASLRAQEPEPAHRPPWKASRPGGRADEALHAPGRVRLRRIPVGRGRARSL